MARRKSLRQSIVPPNSDQRHNCELADNHSGNDVDSGSRLNFLILVCAILIFLIAYHVGLVAIPLGMDTEIPLEILIGILAGIILLGGLGKKRGMDEITAYKFRRVNSAISIGAIAIIVIIMLIYAGIHPPGMDPEVPFLFVIPPLAWLFVVAVVVEETILLLKLDKSQ
jgi:hypothetical protein